MNTVADYPMDIGDYWTVLLRRKWRFLIPFALVMAVSMAIAYTLPAKYRSEATILIESQTIPGSLVATTVTGYVQEQIEQIRQRIVTPENLLDIAEKHDLYPHDRDDNPRFVVREVAQSIEVDMIDLRATDFDGKGQRFVTIAFTVAFSADSPEVARDVTQELADRYLEYNKSAREKQAAEVSDFLGEEAEVLRVEISEMETSQAQFKQEELRQLPELMDVNLRLYDRTEQEIERSKEAARGLEDKIEALQVELSLTAPYQGVQTEDGKRLLTGSERLGVLTAQYLLATARYSAEHPDVVRLRREISQLAQETGNAGRTDELMNELVNLQEQLRQARQKYSDVHPEVQKLETSVAAVQRGFKTAVLADAPDELALPPDNARYVTLKTQLDTTETNLQAERQNLETLQEKLAEYEERLFQTPVVERDFLTLGRDYNNAVAKYKELREKQLQARLAQRLEAGDNAVRWTLTSPAFYSAMPDSPNRLGIALLGFLIAFGAGLVGVGYSEYTDATVRGSRMVANAVGVPPLAVIPNLSASRV